MSSALKRVFKVTPLLFILLVFLASQSHTKGHTPLSSEEELRRALDPNYAAIQEMKEQLEPIPEAEKLQQIAKGISAMSDDKLNELVAYAERIKQRVITKKKRVHELLEAQKQVINAVVLRWAAQTVRMWQAAREHEKRLKEIKQREDEAFRQKYPVDFLRPGKQHQNEWEWQHSRDKDKFDDERLESQRQMGRDLEKIRREMSQGVSSFEQYVNRINSEWLQEYQATVGVISAVKQEQERRRTGREQQKQEEERLAQLRLRTNASSFDVKTGETTEVWLWVEKGLAPYKILYYVPGDTQFGELQIGRAGSFAIPFRFLKPGKYEAQVQATDEDGEMRTVSFRFKVTGTEIKPGEEQQATGTKPEEKKGEEKAEQKPKEPADPKPPKALVGRFRAGLHRLELVSPEYGRLSDQTKNAPFPFILEINASGHITAAVDYEVPEHHLAPDLKRWWKSSFAGVSFRIDGHVNPKSGKTRLLISDVVNRWGGVTKSGNDFQETIIKSEVTVTGWQIPGPEDQTLLNTPIMNVMKHSNACPWVPKAAKQPDGSFAFTDQGFFGIQGMRGSDELVKYKVHSVVSKFRGITKDQGTANLQRRLQKPTSLMSWYLQIFGPAPPPAPPVTAGKGDLVGFGVYPEGPLRVRVGQAITFMAMGVFSNNVFKTEDLTGQAQWQSSAPALRLVKKPSTFMASVPGTYRIRGRIKDHGVWFRDLTTVIVK